MYIYFPKKINFVYIQHFLAFGGFRKSFYLCIVNVTVDRLK